jgi:hypothetical protein
VFGFSPFYGTSGHITVGMHQILILPDIRLIQKPDTWLDNYIFDQISNKFIKTALKIIDFCKD